MQKYYDRIPESVKGYAREMYFYASYLVKPKHNPQKKFLVFGLPRSGTTLLVSLLDSHPQVYCEGEILLRKVLNPKTYIRCRAALSKNEVYGFKLLSSHFRFHQGVDPRRFIADLHQDGYKIINLRRKNILRATLSLLYAISRGQYHQDSEAKEIERYKMHLSPQALMEKLEWMENYNRLQNEVIKDIPNLSLIYEDSLFTPKQQQATTYKIIDYLGIEKAELNTRMIKIGSRELESFIENADEIDSFIQQTRYANFLDYP
jgi:hypothetical protein